jgi:hypothetical protein
MIEVMVCGHPGAPESIGDTLIEYADIVSEAANRTGLPVEAVHTERATPASGCLEIRFTPDSGYRYTERRAEAQTFWKCFLGLHGRCWRPEPTLREYIRARLDEGVSADKAREWAVMRGWGMEEATRALREAQKC